MFTAQDYNPPTTGPDVGLVTEQFTVSNGAITAANFYAVDANGHQILFDLPNGTEGVSGFVDTDGTNDVRNYGNLAGATYAEEVPETSTWALLLGSLGLLVLWRLRSVRRIS